MKKKILFFLVLSACCLLNVYSQQQLTRFAVVDLPKVYTAFFRDSRAVRQFEERSARVQADIDRITREIQDLRSRHADAVLSNNESEVLRLETQIARRSEFLREFYQTRTTELENERRRLMQSGSFLDQVHDEIRLLAEREGLSMVLNLADTKGIIWHSNSVDITDRIIANLQAKANQ